MDISLKEIYHQLRQLQSLIEAERESSDVASLSFVDRTRYWRRGFLSRSAVLYDFETYGYGGFLTDYERYVKTRGINGRFGYALDNKLLTYGVLSGFDEHLPDLHGIIDDGTFRSIPIPIPTTGTRGPTRPAIEWVDDLDSGETVVVKWVLGGGGHNVMVLTRTEDGYRLNGDHTSRAALRERLADLEDYIVTDLADQADYADAIYPEATNTVRAVTMWDTERDEPFIARAIHRIATDETRPTDNWSQGGLSALIDGGRLGEAVTYPDDGELVWTETHPNTGRRIEGAEIPGWDRVRERVLRIAGSVPYLPYVGWDLVITDDGEFEIIEANNYPGMKSLQVHGPLLRDERVRRFYRTHDVR